MMLTCPKCRSANEPGSRFCAGCGAALTQSRPSRASAAEASAGLFCSRCGSTNPEGSSFCESCGQRLEGGRYAGKAVPSVKPVSAAMWLLPILLAWVGGLVAWIIVRESDKQKAFKMLCLGILMTFFWIAVSTGLSFLSEAFSFS